MGASQLQNEFQAMAAEVESVAGETFTFRDREYRGVLNQQPLIVALTVPNSSESATAMLAVTCGQFPEGQLPGPECAQQRETISNLRGTSWRIVSYESDTLHLRLGLVLAV